MKKNSIKNQINKYFVLIIIVPMLISIIWATIVMSSNAKFSAIEWIMNGLENIDIYNEDLLKKSQLGAKLISSIISKENSYNIVKTTQNFSVIDQFGFDIVEIRDLQGDILIKYGDDELTNIIVKQLQLQLNPENVDINGFFEGEKDIYIGSLVPIIKENLVTGTIFVGYSLNSSYIDKIAKFTRSEVSIFKKNKEIETTIKDIYQIKQFSIKITENIKNFVYNNRSKKIFPGKINIENYNGFSYGTKRFERGKNSINFWQGYKPVISPNDQVIGMYFIGIPENAFLTETKQAIISFTLVSILMILLSFYVNFKLSKNISDPINELTNRALIVSKGNFNVDFEIFANNEIDELIKAFKIMILKNNELISSEKNLNFELENSLRFIESILDNMQPAVLVIDNNDKLVIFNRSSEKIFNLNKELLNCDANNLSHMKKVINFMIKNRDEKSKNKMAQIDITIDNKIVPLSILTTLLKDLNNNINGIIAICYDMTEYKELEKHLLRSEKLAAVGQLAAGISHEINNPIAIILNYSELILEDLKENNILYNDIKAIETQALRCSEIIKNLLNYARPTILKNEYLNLNYIIDEVFELLKPQKIMKYVEINKHYYDDLYTYFDVGQFKQLFLNLFMNALHAMENSDEKKLTVKTSIINENNEKFAIISIEDTGHGINDENLSKLFNPFFTTKDPGKGTGLGLSVCNSIIESHNGKIDVISKVGVGTTFTIKIPIIKGA
jgi:PAS domain S-box-containing protein